MLSAGEFDMSGEALEQQMCRNVCSTRSSSNRNVQHILSGGQEGWRQEAHPQSQATQPMLGQAPIHDGDIDQYRAGAPVLNMDGIHRSQGCLPASANLPGPLEVPEVLFQGAGPGVCGDSIRSVSGTHVVHTARSGDE